MFIFESLCQETDDKKRKSGILAIVFVDARKKVADIVCDKDVECVIKTDPQKGVNNITYKNVLGKIILTPNGIDKMNDSGSTWSVVDDETTQISQ